MSADRSEQEQMISDPLAAGTVVNLHKKLA
jgi:hypothetical protein